MSAAKHTPGPWFVDGVRFVRQEPSPRHVICRLPTTTRNEGDARLIAAAPELLEALRLMRNAFLDTEGSHGELERAATEAADAAWAKATGSAA